jgi:hypothetical protein
VSRRRRRPQREGCRDVLDRPQATEKPSTKRQLGNIRSLEKRLGRRRRWLHNRAEATYYFGALRRELNRRDARAERERNPGSVVVARRRHPALSAPPARSLLHRTAHPPPSAGLDRQRSAIERESTGLSQPQGSAPSTVAEPHTFLENRRAAALLDRPFFR